MSEFVITPPVLHEGTPNAEGRVPKLRIPFEIHEHGSLVVEQDSVDELAQCVYAILATAIGEWEDEPEFGISEQAFRKGGADLAELRSAIERWEPRAEFLTDAEFDGVLQRVGVSVA